MTSMLKLIFLLQGLIIFNIVIKTFGHECNEVTCETETITKQKNIEISVHSDSGKASMLFSLIGITFLFMCCQACGERDGIFSYKPCDKMGF
jgi:hypothetical protein